MAKIEVEFTPEKRREIIERAIHKPAPAGGYAGIFGAEPCQVCGELGTFRGWVEANGAHLGGSFACGRCRSRLVAHHGDKRFQASVISAEVRKAVEANPVRYCLYCLRATPKDDCVQERISWICLTCKKTRADGEDVRRRRYVELICDTDEKLAAFDINRETDVLDMEETIRPELKERREERVRERLRATGAAHGIDYISITTANVGQTG